MHPRKTLTLVLTILLIITSFFFNYANADTEDLYVLTINEIGIGVGYVLVNDTIAVMSVPSQFTCAQGDIFQLTAVAASDWNFSGWLGDLISSDTQLTTTMNTNITITALFSQSGYYTIEVDQSRNGTISPSTASYARGSNQDFSITPDSGYFIQSITLDHKTIDVTSPAGQTVSLVDIQSSHILTATYAPLIFNLTVFTIGNGSVIPNNSTYFYGDSVMLTATSDSGYAFKNWSDNSTNVKLTIIMNNNQNVTAIFVQEPAAVIQEPTPSSTPAPTITTNVSPEPTSSAPTSNQTIDSPIANPTSYPGTGLDSNPLSTETPILSTSPTAETSKTKVAGASDILIVIAAGVIFAGIVFALLLKRKKNKTQNF